MARSVSAASTRQIASRRSRLRRWPVEILPVHLGRLVAACARVAAGRPHADHAGARLRMALISPVPGGREAPRAPAGDERAAGGRAARRRRVDYSPRASVQNAPGSAGEALGVGGPYLPIKEIARRTGRDRNT